MNPPFPKRNGQPAQPRGTVTHDPQNQVLCDHCGGGDLRARNQFYRIPGQLIGTVDLTPTVAFVCEGCGELVDITTSKTRKEIQKFEAKPA